MNETLLKNLIKDAQKGDAAAFGRLYAELSHELYRFALYYLRREQDAEDAVQDAALAAYKSIRYLKKTESFRSWFFKILSNECKKTLQKRASHPEEPADEFPTLADASGNDHALRFELAELMNALPDDDRQIVLLSVLEGYSSKEIAAIAGMKANTVRSRLSRSLHKLREELEN